MTSKTLILEYPEDIEDAATALAAAEAKLVLLRLSEGFEVIKDRYGMAGTIVTDAEAAQLQADLEAQE